MVILKSVIIRVPDSSYGKFDHLPHPSLNKALKVAFTGGSVMGLAVVGLGLLGLVSIVALVLAGSAF